MTFKELNLIEPILKALQTEGYISPTPIQSQAIPIVLDGDDLLGCAQTGTGKTAAFAIPILQKLSESKPSRKKKEIRALVLTPTRELAIQIDESFQSYGRNLPVSHTVIFGGVGQKPQTDALQRGVDVLIATPGRLLDLYNQGFIDFHGLEFFVLDEADRMLDMGFIHDIKRLLPLLPRVRQTLFFSATMPDSIMTLANSILNKPKKVAVTPIASTVDVIEQSLYYVEKDRKTNLLLDIIDKEDIESMLIFVRTKHGADKITKALCKAGINAKALHGNKSQTARQNALNEFKERKINVLVATDIASRGIDIDQLSHVINYNLPEVPENYVHRIGRTGRAGCGGIAITFCDAEEVSLLKEIEKLISKRIKVVEAKGVESFDAMKARVTALVATDSKEKEKKTYNGSKKTGDFWRRKSR
ncbi:MAG: DEAD/DEAH box helicase [Rikenellaceae bacterium]